MGGNKFLPLKLWTLYDYSSELDPNAVVWLYSPDKPIDYPVVRATMIIISAICRTEHYS